MNNTNDVLFNNADKGHHILGEQEQCNPESQNSMQTESVLLVLYHIGPNPLFSVLAADIIRC
jgi:hypothetical protein